MRRVLAALLLVPVTISIGACGRAGKQVEQLASIAAEGALMAGDVARGRTKTTFVRVHGAELSAQAEHEAEKLNDDPVAPSLKASIEVAITLASDIGGALDELRVSPQDRPQAREDQVKLQRWALKATGVAETL